MRPDRGELRDTGGRRNRGRKIAGTWKLFFPASLHRGMASIAFLTMGCRKNGLCEVYTIDVRRIARSLCFQFSRRRLHARRIGKRLLGAGHEFNGALRSRWPVWRTTILSSGTKNRSWRAHRRRSRLRAWLALLTAGFFARRIQKSLPLAHTNETP